jgi:hypothetical protein
VAAGQAVSESPGIGRPLLVLAILVLVVVYGSSALTSQDPLWFIPARLDEPASVTVYQSGEARKLAAGAAEYAAVVAALGDAIRGAEASARAGLSDESLRTLTQGTGSAVEIRFDRPQRLGGSHVRGRPTRMLIPLAGPFAQDPFVFLGDDKTWWAEALVSSRVPDVRGAISF